MQIPCLAIELWPKKEEQVGIFLNFVFLGHNFMANNRIVMFFSLNVALDVRNRMIYGLTESDQIYASYGQSSTNVGSANVATRI